MYSKAFIKKIIASFASLKRESAWTNNHKTWRKIFKKLGDD